MDLEALIEQPPPEYRIIKRVMPTYVEFEIAPIGFAWGRGIPADELKVPLGITGLATEEGNTLWQVEHDPSSALESVGIPLGNGGEVRQSLRGELFWDTPLKFADVRAHFEAMTPKLKERTKREYWKSFRAFAYRMELDQFSRKDLAGKKGEELLLRYFGLVKESHPHSLLPVCAGIKKVWRRGLDLPWPLESDDIPNAPSQRIIPGPRRDAVEPWVHAIENERDPYEHSWFMAQFTYGLRAVNQQSALRRQHIVYSETSEKPIGFMVHGADADFKRDSYFIAAIPPKVAEALEGWLKVHPDASPEAHIWPWRASDGNLDPSRPMTEKTIQAMRRNFAKRWHLAYIQSKAVRKFVKATLIQSGMKDPEKSYWQGHAPKRNDMDFVYGSKQPEEIFSSQLYYLPEGPFGMFAGMTAKVGIPPDLEALWAKAMSGQLDRLDAMDAFRAILKRLDRKQPTADLLSP